MLHKYSHILILNNTYCLENGQKLYILYYFNYYIDAYN